jgi:cytochrome c5
MVLLSRSALALFFLANLCAAAADEAPRVLSHERAPGGGIAVAPAHVTWSGPVVRLVQARCQNCHHDGGIAPFPLVTYQDAYEHRIQMLVQTQSRLMPPWHVADSCARFEGDPSLTEDEIAIFARWVDAGAPEGDPARAPAPIAFRSGWTLGEPDLVLPMSEAYTPDFSSGDVYRCFALPTGLSEDRWVDGVEVEPGVASMVHHVLLFIDTADASSALDAADPAPGWTCFGGPGFTPGGALGGWVPGNAPAPLPEGIGILLPARSKVVMQVHYSARSGVLAPDLTKVGLHYARGAVTKRLYTLPLLNTTFTIPAGASAYEVTATVPFLPLDVSLYAITPHMHLLGRTMEVSATLPDGSQRCLVSVPDWDFHWQATYRYAAPIDLPFGTRVDLRAMYDNSADNPENPNVPPKDVSWGERTVDEMCLAFLSFTLPVNYLTAPVVMPEMK